MYGIGYKIVHPMHGAGIIENIVEQKVDGHNRQYYVLKLPVGGMLVMIPVKNCEEIGIRPIIGMEQADKILSLLPSIEIDATQNWNRRYRENMLRIKSGDLSEVARVVKGLMTRDQSHGLSTSERKMLHSAKQILISEIVLAKNADYNEIEQKINGAFV